MDHLRDLVRPQAPVMDRPTLAEMVDDVLAAVEGTFSVAGSSLGGWVAQAVAARAPERVRCLFLIDTWTTAPEAKLADLRQMAKDIEDGRREELLASHRPRVFYRGNPCYTACVERLAQMHRSFATPTLLRQLQAMIGDNSTGHLLPQVRAATLVIHGRHDRLFDLAEARRIADGIAGARLAVIEDAAHGTPLEQPQAVTALMRFYLEGT
jgi:pimeloyl-ACP methyl ester carboxylesterase